MTVTMTMAEYQELYNAARNSGLTKANLTIAQLRAEIEDQRNTIDKLLEKYSKYDLHEAEEGNLSPETFPIEALDLKIRTFNCLKRSGFDTVKSIYDDQGLNRILKIRNFGIYSLHDLDRALVEHGFPSILNADGSEQDACSN